MEREISVGVGLDGVALDGVALGVSFGSPQVTKEACACDTTGVLLYGTKCCRQHTLHSETGVKSKVDCQR